MGLTKEQRQIARKIVKIGQRQGATRKQIKAALAAAQVESGIRNLSGGDRDSVGVFQIRSGIHGPIGHSVDKSARWFFKNAKQADKGQPSGRLAQDVERSAFPHKYSQPDVQRLAGKLLRQYMGGGGGGKSKGGGTLVQPGTDNSLERSKEILSYFKAKRGEAPSAAFNTSAYYGKGIGALRGALEGLPDTPDKKIKLEGRRPSGGGGGGKLRPGGGQAGTAAQAHELSRLAKKMGLGVSGERSPSHNASVGGAADSDHLTTNKRATARDVSGSQQAMDRYARRVAKKLGFKTHKGLQTKVKNGYRYQLIWQAAGHYDHVHVGVRKV